MTDARVNLSDGVEVLHYWRGQPIKDLPRSKLLKIIEFLSEELAKHTTPESIKARAIGSAEMMKKDAPEWGYL